MPVVALRKPASDLPIDFILTDEQVMVPGTHLADFESLIVTARISRSGLATDVVEGLEVWSEPVTPVAGGEIQLLIAAGAQAEDRGNE
jgi:cytochrome c-type biogenesis protein CcmH